MATSADQLGVASNANLVQCLLKFKNDPKNVDAFCGADPSTLTESVLLSKNLIKVNRKGKRQERDLIVTTFALYNFKPRKYKKFQRRICLGNLDKIILVANSTELVIHLAEGSGEYDYKYDAGNAGDRATVCETIGRAFQSLTGAELPQVDLAANLMESLVITKRDARERTAEPSAAFRQRRQSMQQRMRSGNLSALSSASASRAAANSVGSPAPIPKAPSNTAPSGPVGASKPGPAGGGAAKKSLEEKEAGSAPAQTSAGRTAPSTKSAKSGSTTSKSDSGDAKQTAAVGAEGAAGDIAHVIHEVRGKQGGSGDKFAEISGWPCDSVLQVTKMCAELMLANETGDSLLSWLCNVNDWGSCMLDNLVQLLPFDGEDKGEARRWSTSSLWRLLSYFQTKGFMQEKVQVAGGVHGYMTKAYTNDRPVQTLSDLSAVGLLQPVYQALMGIALGQIFRPTEGDRPVEPFGKKLKEVDMLGLIFRLLPTADWDTKMAIMKDMNVLLVKRDENFTLILQRPDWVSWLPLLLSHVPKKQTDRTDVQSEYLKYVMNMFAMILFHVFSKDGDINKTLCRIFHQLQLQVGWTDASVGVARSLVSSVIVKIGNGTKKFKTDIEREEWDSLFKIAAVVEEFIFYRPSQEASMADILAEEEADVPAVLRLTPSALSPTADIPVAPEGSGTTDKKQIGLHISTATGECEDLKLAQRLVSVMQKLGLNGDSKNHTELGTSKKAKERASCGNGILHVFTDIVRFLEEGSSNGYEKMVEQLGKFLEKRQKQKGSGFLSKGANKKNIVKSLQTSLMRQQAQKTIRSQVRTKVAKAKAAVVVEVEEEVDDEVAKQMAKVEKKKKQEKIKKERQRLQSADAAGGGGDGSGTMAADDPEAAAKARDAVEASLKHVQMDDAAKGSQEEADEEADGHISEEEETYESEDEEPPADAVCDDCEQPLFVDEDDTYVCALGGNYHAACLRCAHCERNVADEFYERKGKVYCREDYLSLFGRSICAGCLLPFRKGDEAMEAVDKMWHPSCFVCHECQEIFESDETFFEKDGRPYCEGCNDRLWNTCPACREAVQESDDGINALNKNWHTDCFRCIHCSCKFPAGVYFAKDDGTGYGDRPFCETCFVDLFVPKCHGCAEPVKDSGISAMGYTWHSACFVCQDCSEPFPDGQYFVMDGAPYCQEHYFENFGERCAGCNEVITDQILNALDKTWHSDCFACEHCHEPFGDLGFFMQDGAAYCENDYKELFCPRCEACGEYVTDGGLEALDAVWHVECLVCEECGTSLTESAHRGDDGHIYCEEHYVAMFAQRCERCDEPINGEAAEINGRQWHIDCFVCESCETNLADAGQYFLHDNQPHCAECFAEASGDVCPRCNSAVTSDDRVELLEKAWHADCLTCGECGTGLVGDGIQIFPHDGEPFCQACFQKKFGPKCTGCRGPLSGAVMKVLERRYHKDCVCCRVCDTKFGGDTKMFQREGWPVCMTHARGALTDEQQARLAEDSEASAPAPAPAPAPASAADTTESEGGEEASEEGTEEGEYTEEEYEEEVTEEEYEEEVTDDDEA